MQVSYLDFLVFDLGCSAYLAYIPWAPPLPHQAPPVPPLLALLSAYYIRSQGGGWAAMHIMLQWHREGPNLVVSVLGSCYSRWRPFRAISVLSCRCQQGALILLFRFWVAVTQDKGPPTSPRGAWEMCCCVSSQREPPPRCFGSG